VTGFFSDLLKKPCRATAALLLVALFAANVYRAATQSVAHDEGVAFGWLLAGGWGRVLEFEHGNHHVISDLLCKLSIEVFGLSDFSLRIPALLGGLLYFVSLFALSAALFGEGLLFLLAVAALSLNPFVLDYLSCARGYGPALGFFFYSLYQAAEFLGMKRGDRGAARRPLVLGGVALGLSLGCNPIMVFPGVALVAGLVLLLAADSLMARPEPAADPAPTKPRKSGKRQRNAPAAEAPPAFGKQALVYFAVPAGATAAFFLMLPKKLIELEEGYTGPESLLAIVRELARHSLVHSPSGCKGLTALIPTEVLIRFAAAVAVPALVAGLAGAGVVLARRWKREGSLDAIAPADRFLLLLAGVVAATGVLVAASRHIFQMPYPELRTAMYWLPLLTLACLGLVRMWPMAWVRIPLAVVLTVCVAQFATQFNTRYFAEWAYCAAGKDMVGIIRAQRREAGKKVSVGLSWQLEPVVNFYRVAWKLDWMNPVYRASPDGEFDYFLLLNDDVQLVERRGLKVLLRDPLSRVVLAKRPE
jgi:hypothetical protein